MSGLDITEMIFTNKLSKGLKWAEVADVAERVAGGPAARHGGALLSPFIGLQAATLAPVFLHLQIARAGCPGPSAGGG